MKLFLTNQIAGIDRYTIEYEPIADIDLMERAANEMYFELLSDLEYQQPLLFLAGPGNNGGDALAMARMFACTGFPCEVYLLDGGRPLSGSPAINWQRLAQQGKVAMHTISSPSDFPVPANETLVIDGLFGSGLTRPLSGLAAELVQYINKVGCRVVSIDIPSGMMGEDNGQCHPDHIIKAKRTLTLQFPKLSFLLPGNDQFTGEWKVVDIGLHPVGIEKTQTSYFLTNPETVEFLNRSRGCFSHKGNFGHALLIAGSYGKMGAAVLAARACLRAGAGLVTAHVVAEGCNVLQTAVPEAMCSVDPGRCKLSELPPLTPYSAIAVGPGIGMAPETGEMLLQLIESAARPLVVDADALNLIALHPEWLSRIPENSILTPHPGEFSRLAGEYENPWERLQKQREMAATHRLIIVLKGAFTSVALPHGRVFFNPSGNPGMATAGSGDTLTGILAGLLAQGFSPEQVAVGGVYLHGLAADLAVEELSQPALMAGDIIDYVGKAFIHLKKEKSREF